jgi:hypothetical protein
MSERIFKLPAGHPAVNRVCFRCGKQIGASVNCYLDHEAPATKEDLTRMQLGLAYISTARLVHADCNPREGASILNRAEMAKFGSNAA